MLSSSFLCLLNLLLYKMFPCQNVVRISYLICRVTGGKHEDKLADHLIPCITENQVFVTPFIKARHWTFCWVRWVVVRISFSSALLPWFATNMLHRYLTDTTPQIPRRYKPRMICVLGSGGHLSNVNLTAQLLERSSRLPKECWTTLTDVCIQMPRIWSSCRCSLARTLCFQSYALFPWPLHASLVPYALSGIFTTNFQCRESLSRYIWRQTYKRRKGVRSKVHFSDSKVRCIILEA
jgi:hypothetical protein